MLMARGLWTISFTMLSLLVLACDKPAEREASTTGRGLEIVEAPAGQEPVASLVARAMAKAHNQKRTLLVYVGASWCEPCERFQQAAKKGELDASFPTLRLLKFDHDRDNRRLVAANCSSSLVPLFARPAADGRCSNRRIFGAIKGPGAVDYITPRLKQLLSTPPAETKQ